MFAYLFFALVIVASVVLPFRFRLPRDFRLAGILLGISGLQVTAAWLSGTGTLSLLASSSIAATSYMLIKVWREYSEQRVIRRGEEAVARAEALKSASQPSARDAAGL